MNDYPKSEGALFINQNKTGEKHPDYRGFVTITREQIQTLIQMAKSGLDVKLQLATWDRTSQDGRAYQYVSAEAYIPEQRQSPAPGAFAHPHRAQPAQGHARPQQRPAPVQQPQYPQQGPQVPFGDESNDWDDDPVPF